MPKASRCSAAAFDCSGRLRWTSHRSPMKQAERAGINKRLNLRCAMTDANSSSGSFLDRYFGLTAHHTSVRTEFLAGLTTFLTMVYIVFVNPQILGAAGMDKGAVFVATCIAAADSTLVMGLYANYPIAL